MSTRIYVLPVEQTKWKLRGDQVETVFNWEYDEGRDYLLALYEKGKNKQWNTTDRLDWSHQVDPDNPTGESDQLIAIYGTDLWNSLDEKARTELRRHVQAWRFSQFLHGEQGALICASKIVQTVPDIDSKFYAATQVVDEARHVETYSRFLREKVQLAYPVNASLKALLEQAITDKRWDFTYLAMQVIIEGLALAAFGLARDTAKDRLAKAINAYVMEDEARHVAFGRLALRDYYPQLTEKERDEREEFAIEACYLMRDRFKGGEVLDTLGYNSKEMEYYLENNDIIRNFRRLLFTRIVPTIKDIGMWGPRVRKGFTDMGILEFAEVNVEQMSEEDENIAAELDRLRRDAHVKSVINEGSK